MRYLIEKVTLDKTHPLWPNQELFKLRDLNTGRLSFGAYTTMEAAERMKEKKNAR